MSNEPQKQSIVELYEQRPWAIKLLFSTFLMMILSLTSSLKTSELVPCLY